jgi:tetratricopeptide (TPR) repeat protein
VARVCRGLDGLPLAIELAAARIKVISVQQIAERLSDSLSLLTATGKFASPRHQTLRAALDWSYALLSEAERQFFHRIGVFSGSWTLEAATDIAAGDGLPASNLLDLVASLVDKSLVVAEPGRNGAMRYRLLEPIRQYSLERLARDDDAEAVRARHADCFIALGEQAEKDLRGGPRILFWLDRLGPEQDNIRAALRWCIERDEVERGLRLAGAMWRWWYLQGTFQEGREWLSLVLRLAGGSNRTEARARALNGAGVLAGQHGDYQTAGRMFEESRSIWLDLGDLSRANACLHNVAHIAERRGEYGTAVRLYEGALAVRRDLGNRVEQAQTLTALGWSLVGMGKYDRAREVNCQGLEIFAEIDDDFSATWPRRNLGWAMLLSGNVLTAEALFAQNLSYLSGIAEVGPERTRRGIAAAIEGLAAVAASRGQSDRAVRLYASAAHFREVVGRPMDRLGQMLAARWLEPLRQLVDQRTITDYWSQGEALSYQRAIAYALEKASETELPVATPYLN